MTLSRCLWSITLLGLLAASSPAQSPMPVVAPAAVRNAPSGYWATALVDRPDALYRTARGAMRAAALRHVANQRASSQ